MDFIKNIIRPEFFDIFGIAVFSFITVISIWAYKTQKPLPKWAILILFAIGIAGLIVDGTIVLTTYIL
ncbi:hypothetical protein A2870_01335 [Candidatus Curtissbacteria bacterium RIFCSPHIGHO2_01_FULL_41_11]|uniref:Uncharacterized protein n=1 Tax=Candidatus Curtissbacteria bacterium RIFCSPHIGHO2_01_FULL_41_11 TaxID=1797711 RepID=A0A1F5G676_9BACT|nr:MAG: hypothetical protein A2870_01335 [Candidatus Curtissbacteria bacterium RIFCSPHIGHO2_01_FULL_41_11]